MTRILALGDSVTMGLFVEDRAAIWTEVLERRLTAAGHAVEVINFGVSGYNTGQEVALLEDRGLRLSPDLVVLQYSLNDVEEVNGGIVARLRELEEEGAAVDRNLLQPWLSRSALYRLVAARRLAPARDRALADLASDTVAESFRRLASLASDHGFAVFVAVFPEFRRYREEDRSHHERLRELSTAHGFSHLDLYRAFAECAARLGPEVAVNVSHPSAAGHECAGNALSTVVATLLSEPGQE